MERGPKVGAVDLGVAGGLWIVEVFAFYAVEFHGRVVGSVVLTHGKEGLLTAHYTRAFAKFRLLEFFELRSWLVVVVLRVE